MAVELTNANAHMHAMVGKHADEVKALKHKIEELQGTVDAINKKWIQGWIRKNWKDVKNPDLWQRLLPLLTAYKPSFIWVKGHADNALNNRCDELATQAADGGSLLADVVYEASNGRGI